MNRWDTAPLDGGISIDHQQAEAEARQEEVERAQYLVALADEYEERATALLHVTRFFLRSADPMIEEAHKALVIALRGALRDGVRRAANGREAEWILEP